MGVTFLGRYSPLSRKGSASFFGGRASPSARLHVQRVFNSHGPPPLVPVVKMNYFNSIAKKDKVFTIRIKIVALLMEVSRGSEEPTGLN